MGKKGYGGEDAKGASAATADGPEEGRAGTLVHCEDVTSWGHEGGLEDLVCGKAVARGQKRMPSTSDVAAKGDCFPTPTDDGLVPNI